MLYDYCLDNMTEEELRNYACHMNEIEESYGSLVCAYNEELELLRQLYNTRGQRHNSLNRLNLKRDNFADFEHEMREKYQEFAPRPVCDKE